MNAIDITIDALKNRTTNKNAMFDVVLFVMDNKSLHKSIIKNKDNYTDLVHDLRGLMNNDKFFVPRVLNYK
jgi:hypothetical protein